MEESLLSPVDNLSLTKERNRHRNLVFNIHMHYVSLYKVVGCLSVYISAEKYPANCRTDLIIL